MSSAKPPAPDPKRFEVSKRTLMLDRAMTQLIRIGGLAVIIAVFGIFFFIVREILPLFSGAQVEAEEVVSTPGGDVQILGVDEWGEHPFLYRGGDEVVFIDMVSGERSVLDVPSLKDVEVTASSFDPVHRRVAVGLADGRVGSFLVVYQTEFSEDGTRTIVPTIETEPWFTVSTGEGKVTALSYGDGGDKRLLMVARDQGLAALRLGKKRALIGKPKLTLQGTVDLTESMTSGVVSVTASQNGQAGLVSGADGQVRYFQESGGEVTLVQTFEPFHGAPPVRMDYLFGGVSVALTDAAGDQKVFSLFRPEGSNQRLFGETKEFPGIGTGAPVFAPSLRNKSFLTGAGGQLSVRHLTSGAVRWEGFAEFEPVAATIDGKTEHFFIVGHEGQVQRFSLKDPHPEAGWRAFFGKVWYEGGSEPVFQWQSTGGSDDFEPKLSLIPLIVGSLKGTFYALLFSLPIALLAAVFSAAFLPHDMKRVVKPAMEIMASLPSVVLGFLAGIWLAPIIEDKVPSILLVCLSLPLSAMLVGVIWSRQPIQVRGRFEGGREWMVMVPVVLLIGWLAWMAGPLLEKAVFIYKEPESGREIADFRLWWPQATGLSFDQRNSLVVGFMMGFAVIPVIFTIAEDALSNVPKTLTAASAALGASRWQVVRTVIIPVASPGIFSALMIGFGRAVGETMIVVMATGNTPVTEWNIFSGMRTLSANIAVELPEAAPGSTHYRTLFLGALVLFMLTFILNSVAEVMRQRLREKNKLV
ncbi:phosphate transport system permease protein [Haloferula luteola]|uniref:Phosphate transport system permease protein n=1 Tax=Haloferula luteola TaxID=595692 RepID=A0A840UVV6_9BACT|nr:ABC transporter permease subunit [Haloferula luteola]MBB5349855.1 phosphate transport system permease protein [Haloferula luteola]